jgi:hypothetical protein
VAYKVGVLNAAFNMWCGALLLALTVWLLWELWNVAAPKAITDDFLTLLDDSFGRDWRKPRTWPWARMMWAYGFTLAGATSALLIGVLISAAISSATSVKTPTGHVETSMRFKVR